MQFHRQCNLPPSAFVGANQVMVWPSASVLNTNNGASFNRGLIFTMRCCLSGVTFCGFLLALGQSSASGVLEILHSSLHMMPYICFD